MRGNTKKENNSRVNMYCVYVNIVIVYNKVYMYSMIDANLYSTCILAIEK